MSGVRYLFLKLARDLANARGRALALVVALIVGASAFGATLGAFGILMREVPRAYLDTVPATMTLHLEPVSEELAARVAAHPDVESVTRRRTLHARVRTGDGVTLSALVFVADDLEHARLAKVQWQSGARAPQGNTVLIERSALELLGPDAGVGMSFSLSWPGGTPQRVALAGVTYEAALAPAKTHETLYLYATPELAERLGAGSHFDELRLLLRDGTDEARVRERAQSLARWVEAEGLGHVHEIRVPPPGRHPHQSQLTAVLSLLLVFAILVFFLSCVLASALLDAMMARQVREIGVLKAIGATTRQLGVGFVSLMLGLSVITLLVAGPLGFVGAEKWAASVSALLNFDLIDERPPTWVLWTQLGLILALPSFAALPAIRRGTTLSVQAALGFWGARSGGPVQRTRFFRWVERASPEGSTRWLYNLQSAVRQRRRLLLSTILFATGGAITIAAFSVAAAWDEWGFRLRQEQRYDVSVSLLSSADATRALQTVEGLEGVGEAELWWSAPTSKVSGEFPIRRTYPDDAHGAFALVAPPLETRMLAVPLLQGRWAKPGEAAVVINQLVPGYRSAPVGSVLELSVGGLRKSFTVVGKVEQVGVGAIAYTSLDTFRELFGCGHRGAEPGICMTHAEFATELRVREGEAHTERVSLSARGKAQSALGERIERALTAQNVPVESVISLGVYENAMVAHFEVLVVSLLVFAVVAALVGALGLGSAVLIGVIERTRELGVLKALGATATQIRVGLVLEGMGVGALSSLVAACVGALLAWGLGTAIGVLSFALPLPLTLSLGAVARWTLSALVLSALATLPPASLAARTTVAAAVRHI